MSVSKALLTKKVGTDIIENVNFELCSAKTALVFLLTKLSEKGVIRPAQSVLNVLHNYHSNDLW